MKSREISRFVNWVTCGQRKYGWWSSDYQSADCAIVIGGCGRSGTTLMRSLLNAHRNIVIGPETGIFCGATDFTHLSDALLLPRDTVRRTYRRASCQGEFVSRLMSELTHRSGKPRWGEKSPCNVNSIGRIFQFFPSARFIHMVRDGRDVMCSLRDHPKYRWENGVRVPTNVVNPWESCVRRWVTETRNGLAWRGDGRYIEVRYEELVATPEPVMKKIVDWLGEEWDPAILTFYNTHEERGSDVANPGVKLPIYRSAQNRWAREWTAEVDAAFTPDARELLVELAYEPHMWSARPSAAATSSQLQPC